MKRVLKFYSKTCGPCRVISSNLEKLTGVEVQSIDIADEASEALVDQFKIRTVPTVVVLDDDTIIKEFKGIVPTETIQEVIDNA